jgi:hypothetical protein
MLGGAGIDATSSAQSRRVGTGVERGGIGLQGGETGDGGCKTGPGGHSDMVAAVEDGRDDVDVIWGGAVDDVGLGPAAGGLGVAVRCSGVTVHSPGWGIAGGSAVVDGYVDGGVAAGRGGSGHGTTVWGTSWGAQGGLGGGTRRRWGSLGWQDSFVESTTRSDEHVCSSSCDSVCWAIDCRWGSLVA